MGLSIVRSIVTGYAGTIQVESKVGQGTRFVISLPACTDQPSKEENRLAPSPKGVDKRGRVLVIDDEPGILRALRRVLRAHEVVVADSGEQALDLLARDQQFHVILCDVMMRPTSGMDVHRWLITHHPLLASRVMFLTGGAFTPHARIYLEKVENPRIEKPFDTTNLLKLVRERVRAAMSNE